jgi:competence protein ComEA
MFRIKLYFSIPLTVLLTLGLVLGVLAASGLAQQKVDLNAASEKELEAIKGVGPATANKIVTNRPYKSVDELSKAGLSAKQIDSLKPFVTVGAAAPTPAPAPKGAKVDLNAASEKELEAIKGVGPATAKKIVTNRPYKSVDELSKAGLSAKQIDSLKPFVTVGATAPAPAPAPKGTKAATPAQPTPSVAKTPATSAPKLAPGQTVNINRATKAELEALPDIGPVKAQAIIDGRPYKTKEDIMKVKGIKEGTFGQIKDLITVD